MIYSAVPPESAGERLRIGPPAGVAEEDCYAVTAAHSVVQGGVFDGAPVLKVYFTFDAEDTVALEKGAMLELGFLGESMPVFILDVHKGD